MITWLLPLMVACNGAHDGTAVGNPGFLDVGATSQPDGLSLSLVEFGVDVVDLVGCDAGVVTSLDRGWILDALAPSEVPVEIPAGDWCGLELDPMDAADLPEGMSGPFQVEGATDDGQPFAVGVDPGRIALHGSFHVDGDHLLVGIPLADLLGPDFLEAVQSWGDPEGELADAWADQAGDLGLWDDANGDGQPDSQLFGPGDSGGPTDTGPAADTHAGSALKASDGACGCATGSPVGMSLLGLAGAFLLAKRRNRTR